jgi:hypothetical protein
MTRCVRWLGGICGMERHTTRSSRFDAHVPRARCAQGKGESLVDLLEALHVASTSLNLACPMPSATTFVVQGLEQCSSHAMSLVRLVGSHSCVHC